MSLKAAVGRVEVADWLTMALQGGRNRKVRLLPVGEVVGIIQRANQDVVVSIAEEDQKTIQSQQAVSRSVS